MKNPTVKWQEEILKVTPEQILAQKELVILPAIEKKLKEICPELEREELDHFVVIEENREEEQNSITFSITLTDEGKKLIEKFEILSGIRAEIEEQKKRSEEGIIVNSKEYPSGEEGEKKAHDDIKQEETQLNHPDTTEREKFSIRQNIRALTLLLTRQSFHKKEKALNRIKELTKLIQSVKTGDESGLNKPQKKAGNDLLQKIEYQLKRIEGFVSMPIEIQERPRNIPNPKKEPTVKKESHSVSRSILTLLAVGIPVIGGISWKNAKDKSSSSNEADPQELVLNSPKEIVTAFIEKNRANNLDDVKSLTKAFSQEYPELCTEGTHNIENMIFLKNFQTIIEQEASDYDWEKALVMDPLFAVEGANSNILASSIANFLLDIQYLRNNPRILNECGQKIAPQLHQELKSKLNFQGSVLQGIRFEGGSISFIW